MTDVDRVLVFIPAYNCAAQIGRVLARFDDHVCACVDAVAVIDNRSRDHTVAAARAALAAVPLPGRVLVNRHNYNLGGSHKVAFDLALSEGFSHLVVLHGDDQADIRDLTPYLRHGIHRRHDCLLGARFHPRAHLSGYSFSRIAGNLVFNTLFSMASGRHLIDLGSGLNCFASTWLANRHWRGFADNLTFNYHLILDIAASGADYRFFPISWREEDQISNMRAVRQVRQMSAILRDHLIDPHRARRRQVQTEGYCAETVYRQDPAPS